MSRARPLKRKLESHQKKLLQWSTSPKMRRPLRPRGYKCAICQQFPALEYPANTTVASARQLPLISDYDCVMHNEIGCCSRKTERKRLLSFFACKMEEKRAIHSRIFIHRGCYFYLFYHLQFCDVRTQSKRAFIAFGLKKNTQCIIKTQNESLLKKNHDFKAFFLIFCISTDNSTEKLQALWARFWVNIGLCLANQILEKRLG